MSKHTFEDFLMEKHAEQFIGTKDCMVDDFSIWLHEEISPDEIIEFADEFQKQINAKLLEVCKTIENVLRNRDEYSWFPVEKRIQVQQIIAKAEGGD